MGGEVGQVIGGRFRLLGQLGSGGFGRVWRARDIGLGVDVAIKEVRLPADSSNEERAELLARAEREARNAARLRDHPNIVTVYEMIEVGGVPWIVMQLVNGHSLADELKKNGPLPEFRAIALARELLKAVRAAHDINLIHRDIKPANILLTAEGGVLLTDFGIAVHRTDPKLTATNVMIGTLGYTAPERWQDAPANALSDMYSLGATLYEAAEGVLPFPRENYFAAQSQAPRAMRQAESLASLLRAMLAGVPQRRPTADEALRRLDDLSRRSATHEQTVKDPGPETPEPPPGRNRPFAERPSASVEIRHSRQALIKRAADSGSHNPAIGLCMALIGGLVAILLDGYLHQGHFPAWGGALIPGIIGGGAVGIPIGFAVGFLKGMFLTSDSVTFDDEKITVTEGLETVCVQWADLSGIALRGLAVKQLVVWSPNEDLARRSRLARKSDLDDEVGTAYVLYSTARKNKDPQRLEPGQLLATLNRYAGDLNHSYPRLVLNAVAAQFRHAQAWYGRGRRPHNNP